MSTLKERLDRIHDDILAAGGTLVAISPQTLAVSAEVKRKWRLPYPVLVDTDNAYANQLGLAFELPEDLRSVYGGFGIDLPAAHASSACELPLPTRLVIARDGTVASIDADPDYTVRPEARASVEALRSLG